MRGGPAWFAHDMSAVVVAAAYGGPEVLSVIDVPAGDPGPGQARIAVRAAAVNPIDYKLYSGGYGSDPARLPMRLGFEAAGMVTAVGPDAVGPAGPIRVGDEAPGVRHAAAVHTERLRRHVPAADYRPSDPPQIRSAANVPRRG